VIGVIPGPTEKHNAAVTTAIIWFYGSTNTNKELSDGAVCVLGSIKLQFTAIL